MADLNDPKSETVPGPLPLRPAGSGTRDSVRPNLPLPPDNPTPPSPLRPPVAQVASATTPGPGPKKETGRITVLPSPQQGSAPVRTENAQPFNTTWGAWSSGVPVKVIATKTGASIDVIPSSLCWTLLGASVAILLIQIWNYLS